MTTASGDSFISPTASPNSLGVRAAVELEVNLDILGPSLSPILAFSTMMMMMMVTSPETKIWSIGP